MSTNVVDEYGWKEAGVPYSGTYLTSAVISILRGLNSRRVADIGAGNGYLCGQLSKAGFEAVGVEYDAQGCLLARKAHPRLHFYNFGVQDDPRDVLANEAPFDTVVSTEVIEHLFAPHLLPKYAAGLLTPGGKLVISTPYHGYLKNLALAILGQWDHHHHALWHGGHIKFFSRRTLATLLEQNGFRVLAFSGVGRAPYLWKSMIVVAEKT